MLHDSIFIRFSPSEKLSLSYLSAILFKSSHRIPDERKKRNPLILLQLTLVPSSPSPTTISSVKLSSEAKSKLCLVKQKVNSHFCIFSFLDFRLTQVIKLDLVFSLVQTAYSHLLLDRVQFFLSIKLTRT